MSLLPISTCLFRLKDKPKVAGPQAWEQTITFPDCFTMKYNRKIVVSLETECSVIHP